jgi:TPP-dependent pyruvate/acetoin dehydrogenase alpha subunit
MKTGKDKTMTTMMSVDEALGIAAKVGNQIETPIGWATALWRLGNEVLRLRGREAEATAIIKAACAEHDRVHTVYRELFDRQVKGETLTAEDAIESFRLAMIGGEPVQREATDDRG